MSIILKMRNNDKIMFFKVFIVKEVNYFIDYFYLNSNID